MDDPIQRGSSALPQGPSGASAETPLDEALRQRVWKLQEALEPQHQRVLDAHAQAETFGERTMAEILGVSPEAARQMAVRAREALAEAIRAAGLTAADFLEGRPDQRADTLRLALPVFDRALVEEKPSTPSVHVAPAQAGRPRWPWYGAAAAALAVGLLGLLFFSSGTKVLEPELLHAVAPTPAPPNKPLPPWPVKLELSAAIVSGRLELAAPRLPTDSYRAIALIDGKNQKWLAQAGDAPDPGCSPACDELKATVDLESLAPGAFRVMVMVSSEPITRAGIWQWLPQAEEVAPRWLGVRAYAVRRLDH